MTQAEKRTIFAGKLKALRARAELSQPELAERSKVNVGTIRQFEQGRREPTYGTLVKLAAGLGVSLSAFDMQAEDAPPAVKGKPAAKAKPAAGAKKRGAKK